ncbi:hypothetical protein [Rhizobium sp. 11515TR]|uniref:hypothetical protein n=1 Tax=Rhizobium sp. 11515TR TaxID=2028343 RepID=UPI000BA85A0C|nr:hypothetical protein [Rhizobium sp. 11515TR]ASW06254.1 hypothetical protein CKA34_10410 [Rhizobium sp. 11515TR]
MDRTEYWEEAIGQALCEIEKFDLFTSDEIKELGEALAISAEHQSMAFGWDVASSNRAADLRREEDSLRKELARERAKIICRSCNGSGYITTPGPYHSSTSQCFKCHGDGRHDP